MGEKGLYGMKKLNARKDGDSGSVGVTGLLKEWKERERKKERGEERKKEEERKKKKERKK